jgi:hypothetical protein
MQSLVLNTVCTSQLRQRWRLQIGELAVEAELDLHLHVLEGDRLVAQRHAIALVVGDVVVVAPLVDAHLLADEADVGRWPARAGLAAAELVDGDRGVVPVAPRPR